MSGPVFWVWCNLHRLYDENCTRCKDAKAMNELQAARLDPARLQGE